MTDHMQLWCAKNSLASLLSVPALILRPGALRAASHHMCGAAVGHGITCPPTATQVPSLIPYVRISPGSCAVNTIVAEAHKMRSYAELHSHDMS